MAEIAERKFLRRKEALSPAQKGLSPLQQYQFDQNLAADTDAQAAISENRWYISQATMYALLALMEK